MYKHSDKNGMHPTLIKLIIGGVCTAVLLFIGISTFIDHHNEKQYQDWARNENQKVYNQSHQRRVSDRQIAKFKKQLNDSFYERLNDGLPVRVLLLGDAYGSGYGASSKSSIWSKLLINHLKLKYGVSVDVTDITLSGMNGCYGTWAQLMAQPDGTAAKVLTDANAAKNNAGMYTGEGIDNKIISEARKTEYDLCIVSLGMTDDPSLFPTYYEGVLRELRRKYQKCSVISLLSNQAMTAPDLGLSDENYDSLYSISDHYKVPVINVGLEMVDPDAASKGATASEIAFGSYTSESLAASMRADGISGQKADAIAADDLEARSKKARVAIDKYTLDGLYLNNQGQEFLAETLAAFIDAGVKKQTLYHQSDISPISAAVETLDEYYYFPVSQLKKIDDFTYVLPESIIAATDPDLSGIVGIDYKLVFGDNDMYLAVGDGTESLGRISINYPGDSKVQFFAPVNDGYNVKHSGSIRIGFATREQASTINGVIIGGDFNLPSYFDDYIKVPYIGPVDADGNPIPVDKDGIRADAASAETDATAETTQSVSETTTSAETSAVETAAASQETQAQTASPETAGEVVGSGDNAGDNTEVTAEVVGDTTDDAGGTAEIVDDTADDAEVTAEVVEITTDDSTSGTAPSVPQANAGGSDEAASGDTTTIQPGQVLTDEQISAILESVGQKQ